MRPVIVPKVLASLAFVSAVISCSGKAEQDGAAGASGGAGASPSAGAGGKLGAGGTTSSAGAGGKLGAGGASPSGGSGGSGGHAAGAAGSSSTAGTGGQSSPAICGGFAGNTCSASEYCAYMPGQLCGAADASSTCQPRPNACTDIYMPVCGCDQKTYSSVCDAAASGQGVYTLGVCGQAASN